MESLPDQLLQDYDVHGDLGHGSFGAVRLATHLPTQQLVAIKIIEKRRVQPATYRQISQEAAVLKSLPSHAHIVKLYQTIETATHMCLVLEYAAGGDLFDFLVANGPLPEWQAANLFAQLVEAVATCHANNIVHHDIKAENLLFAEPDRRLLKLADFGFASFCGPDQRLSSWSGSPTHAAPELFSAQSYHGPGIDLWSMGVVLYIMVCGTLPFNSQPMPRLRQAIQSGRYTIPEHVPAACADVIRGLLQVDPARRFTIAQLLSHPWLEQPIAAVKQRMADEQRHDEAVAKSSQAELEAFLVEHAHVSAENLQTLQSGPPMFDRAYACLHLYRDLQIAVSAQAPPPDYQAPAAADDLEPLALDQQTGFSSLDDHSTAISPVPAPHVSSATDAEPHSGAGANVEIDTAAETPRSAHQRRGSIEALTQSLVQAWATVKLSQRRLSRRMLDSFGAGGAGDDKHPARARLTRMPASWSGTQSSSSAPLPAVGPDSTRAPPLTLADALPQRPTKPAPLTTTQSIDSLRVNPQFLLELQQSQVRRHERMRSTHI